MTLKKSDYYFVISISSVLLFAALFVFRSLDDNRLMSWQWVFAHANASRVFLCIMAAIIAAYLLSNISSYERRPHSFLFLLSFCAAAALWSEPEMIVDASRYFTQAKHLELYGIRYFFREWGGEIAAWTDMPLVPFLYGMIFRIFGEARIYIQAFNALLFSGTVLLTLRLGRALYDEETGFIGGLMLLGMPYLLTQAPLMLVDVPTMFFLMLCIYSFISALERGGARRIVFSSLAVFFSVFSKYSAWLLLSVLPVALIAYLVRKEQIASRIYIYRAALILSIASVLIGAVVYYKYDVISEQIRLLLSFQRPGLGRWQESLISTFLFQVHPFVTAAAVYSLYAGIRKKDGRYIVICWLVLLVIVPGIRRIRYILPVFPMFALMASYGLRKMEFKEIGRFIAFTAFLSSFAVAFFGYLPFGNRMSVANLKYAGLYLNSRDISGVKVFTAPLKDPVLNPAVSVSLLDLYTKKEITYLYDAECGHSTVREDISKSSLRFTWEYKNPRYYTPEKKIGRTAIVVISDDAGARLPRQLRKRLMNHRPARTFDTHEDVFRYRTNVAIYESVGR